MSNDHTGSYLKAIGKIPLLTAEEEIILNRQILEWLIFRDRIGPLTKQELRKERVGKRAHKKFMEANLRLVVSIAKKYNHMIKTLDLMDLVQEGNIGLTKAVEKFDASRGYKFSTYGYWWIRQAITRAIQMQDRMVRLPGHAHDLLMKIRAWGRVYAQQHGRDPSMLMAAKEFDIDPKLLESYLLFEWNVQSLDKPQHHSTGSHTTLADIIPDPNYHSVEHLDEIILHQFYHQLVPLMAQLPKRNQEVVQMRFFSGSYTQPSWRTIANALHMCHENARNTCYESINRIKRKYKLLDAARHEGAA